jgi:hypothetical protein
MRKGRVVVDQFGTVIRGQSYCYRSHTAALAESRRSTVRPDVTVLDVAGETVYLACGDDWIDDRGRQGTHHYGRRGRYVNLETDLPLCVQVMGCYCAGHARGNAVDTECDTSEEG